MALARWSQIVKRSSRVVAQGTSDIFRMSGADVPDQQPRTLFTFNSREDLASFAKGSDSDVGGTSTVHLDLDEQNLDPDGLPAAKFFGNLSLDVKKEFKGGVRPGYAAFRSKRRPTLFGELKEDLSFHQLLALRVRYAGHPRLANSWFVNLQSEGYVQQDLWQHRLYFNRTDGGWEDIFLPLRNFVLTNYGEIVETHLRLDRSQILTAGISLLGGNNGLSGPFELGISSIRAMNEQDIAGLPNAHVAIDTDESKLPRPKIEAYIEETAREEDPRLH